MGFGKTVSRMAAFALATLFLMASAHAAGNGTGGPSFFDWKEYASADKSVTMFLMPVFGTLFGGPENALATALKVINGVCLLIGGMIAGYVLIVGTVATAHDGEMMGKRWSSIWVPIRMALGTALVIPTASGFCAAQLVVGWLVIQSVGMADATWTKFTDKYFSNQVQGMTPNAFLPRYRDFATNVLRSNVCMEAYNRAKIATDAGGHEPKMPGPMEIMKSTGVGGVKGSYRINYGVKPGSPTAAGPDTDETLGSTACGGFDMRRSVISKNAFTSLNDSDSGAAGQSNGGEVYLEELGAVLPESGASTTGRPGWDLRDFESTANKKVIALAVEGIKERMLIEMSMSPEIQTITAHILEGRDNDANTLLSFEQMVLKYEKKMAAEIRAAMANDDLLKQMRDSAQKDGWLLAGMWFMKASQMQDALSRAVSIVPVYTPPNEGAMSSLGNTWSSAKSSYVSFMGSFEKLGSAGPYGNLNEASQGTGGGSGLKNLESSFIATSMAGQLSAIFQGLGGRHPMMALKDIGDMMLATVEGAAQRTMTKKFAAAWNKIEIQDHGESLASAESAESLSMFSSVIIMIGGTFSVVLPMLPFIIFFGAAVGWLILVAEAVVAAPLWAIMKIAPGGEDIMGGSRPAYMLLLGLMLRPALMVMGFIMALFVIEAVMSAFMAVFLPAMLMSVGEGIGKLVSLMITAGVFFMTSVFLIKQILGLIYYIPDHILRWIGGNVEGMGQQMGQGAASAAEGGANQVGSMAAAKAIDGGGDSGKGAGAAGVGSAGGAGAISDSSTAGASTSMTDKGAGSGSDAAGEAAAQTAGSASSGAGSGSPASGTGAGSSGGGMISHSSIANPHAKASGGAPASSSTGSSSSPVSGGSDSGGSASPASGGSDSGGSASPASGGSAGAEAAPVFASRNKISSAEAARRTEAGESSRGAASYGPSSSSESVANNTPAGGRMRKDIDFSGG